MKSIFIALALGLTVTAPVAAQLSDEALAPVYNALEDPCDFKVFAETYRDSAFAPLALRRGEACAEAGQGAAVTPAPWRRYDDTDWNTADEEAVLQSLFAQTDLAALVDAADAGDTMAGYLAAQALWRGVGVWRDQSRALALYAQNCEAGHLRSCVEQGLAYSDGDLVEQDFVVAHDLWRRACDAAEAFGCSYLGYLYATGQGGLTEDDARASELYRRACDAGVPSGCGQLGFMYKNGHGVAQDLPRAMGLYSEGCDGGYSIACNNLANQYYEGAGVERDRDESFRLWERSCTLGNGVGCRMVGRDALGEYRVRAEADRARAFEFFELGCAANDEHACIRLGDLRERVWRAGVPPQSQSPWWERGFEDVRRACEDGSGGRDACAMHALQSLDIPGGWSADTAETAIAACDAGDLVGCYAVAYARTNGFDGVEITDARADALARRACEGGEMFACMLTANRIAADLSGGASWSGSMDEMRNLAHRACRANILGGCGLYAASYAVGYKSAPHTEAEVVRLLGAYCDGGTGSKQPCHLVALAYATPRGVAQDMSRAQGYAAASCEDGNPAACDWVEENG